MKSSNENVRMDICDRSSGNVIKSVCLDGLLGDLVVPSPDALKKIEGGVNFFFENGGIEADCVHINFVNNSIGESVRIEGCDWSNMHKAGILGKFVEKLFLACHADERMITYAAVLSDDVDIYFSDYRKKFNLSPLLSVRLKSRLDISDYDDERPIELSIYCDSIADNLELIGYTLSEGPVSDRSVFSSDCTYIENRTHKNRLEFAEFMLCRAIGSLSDFCEDIVWDDALSDLKECHWRALENHPDSVPAGLRPILECRKLKSAHSGARADHSPGL